MKLVFESTESFEKEISFFDDNQRLLIVSEINNHGSSTSRRDKLCLKKGVRY
jgi:hypothetical protein